MGILISVGRIKDIFIVRFNFYFKCLPLCSNPEEGSGSFLPGESLIIKSFQSSYVCFNMLLIAQFNNWGQFLVGIIMLISGINFQNIIIYVVC